MEALQALSMKALIQKPLRGEIDDIAESLYIRMFIASQKLSIRTQNND